MSAQRGAFDVVKRGIDLIGAGTGLVLLSPVIGATALLVRVKLGSPVLFKQERAGLDGNVFTLYKFRSMLDVDATKGLVTDEDRLTKFGQVLRSTSLDELPSLFNVLRGDMSLVGPRPLLVEYLNRYTPEQARRHEVRPGITGAAQVSGRNSLTWEQKFAYDVEYVDNRSFIVDMLILLKTTRSVFAREGINQQGHVSMARFGDSDG
ncbi:sugar transferase [Glutamicibacter sp. BSL13]